MKIIKMKNSKTTKKKWELEMNEKEPLQQMERSLNVKSEEKDDR